MVKPPALRDRHLRCAGTRLLPRDAPPATTTADASGRIAMQRSIASPTQTVWAKSVSPSTVTNKAVFPLRVGGRYRMPTTRTRVPTAPPAPPRWEGRLVP